MQNLITLLFLFVIYGEIMAIPNALQSEEEAAQGVNGEKSDEKRDCFYNWVEHETYCSFSPKLHSSKFIKLMAFAIIAQLLRHCWFKKINVIERKKIFSPFYSDQRSCERTFSLTQNGQHTLYCIQIIILL